MKPGDKVYIKSNGQLVQGTLIQKRLWGWVATYKQSLYDGSTLAYTKQRVGWFSNWKIWPVEQSPLPAKQGDKT